MKFYHKRGMGGVIHIGQKIENAEGLAVLASIGNSPTQRLLVDALRVGLISNGHSLEKLS